VRMIGIGIGALVAVAVIGAGAWVYMANNVETPNYAVVVADGDIEIRDYPALVVAQVRRSGDRRSAVNRGFSPLANYIFAKDRAGDGIAMTAPVTQQQDVRIAMTAPVTQSADNGEWIVRFIMPSEYALDDLPLPAGDDVTLEPVPATRQAVIRFSGVADDELIAQHEAALRDWLMKRGIEPRGVATYAYYNAPFTPGFLRRNEVMFDIAPDAS
jgi:DNA gyrase inhibitor GyrI